MAQIALPPYAELEQALSKTALTLHPSQAHGIVCGMLCGQPNSEVAWEALVTGGKEGLGVHEVLQALYKASQQQLSDLDFKFELLLPMDDEELMMRAEALTLWCQGFLTGLEQAKIPLSHREPGEMTEAITDIIEIAKMNYEAVISSEEDEAAYVELIEFVRMAVILIFQTATVSTSAH